MLKTQPVAYTYRAEQLCPNCTIETLKREGRAEPYDDSTEDTIIALSMRAGVDYFDEYSYDSDNFPKPVFDWQIECGFDPDGGPNVYHHERCGACNTPLCQ